MLNRIFKSGLIGFFSLVMIVAFTSCQKEKDTIGVIKVQNSGGQAIENASVKLFPTHTPSEFSGEYPNSSLTKTNNTDANGEAQFTYDLEVVLNIEVTKVDGNSTYTGTNVIQLLKGKTKSVIVVIN
jgi:hypothetical protein